MVRHIVMWRLKKELSDAEKERAYERIKAGFEALPGKIPGLLKMEIGLDFNQGPDASDLVLYSEFDSPPSSVARRSSPPAARTPPSSFLRTSGFWAACAASRATPLRFHRRISPI